MAHARRAISGQAAAPAVQRALAESLVQHDADAIRCLACARCCLLGNDQVGYCSAIINSDDTLYSTTYGVAAEVNVTPIESKPIYHYRPGARVLSIGGLGCNLHCRFCQNWEVAFRDARTGGGLTRPNLAPQDAIELALAQQCAGIAWTYNEPSISPMYVLDCARLAHEAGLFTVYVTNGLMTLEAMELLGPWLDVYRVDVKSLAPAFYRRVGNTDRISGILPLAQRAKERYGAHVEVVRNLMPGLNDGEDESRQLAMLVYQLLGRQTPLHFTTYVPYAMMTHVPPTPPSTLARARTIALHTGLQFVYTDNVADPESAHTCCPICNTLIVTRTKTRVAIEALAEDGTCARCGGRLGMQTSVSAVSVSAHI